MWEEMILFLALWALLCVLWTVTVKIAAARDFVPKTAILSGTYPRVRKIGNVLLIGSYSTHDGFIETVFHLARTCCCCCCCYTLLVVTIITMKYSDTATSTSR